MKSGDNSGSSSMSSRSGTTRPTGLAKALSWLLIGLVRAWQVALSTVLGPSCRFHPSCSAYAVEALERHGAWRGGWLVLRRLSRCHPFHEGGLDPVP